MSSLWRGRGGSGLGIVGVFLALGARLGGFLVGCAFLVLVI